jgi:hypothetical protein
LVVNRFLRKSGSGGLIILVLVFFLELLTGSGGKYLCKDSGQTFFN